ncbi:U6 snRNA-associated Sm-like protein LSm2 [Fukomys damarensis]|uniref:U6 snRNA-associated Sm-like protein LSm2 n=1 Tax=Fukomys damarensis TaxID=885580 RepID=A0A091CPH1_FUKDA|nr:U6 snRNA-associated Sm-like protein LSm2 [Fukomys damarensis]
MTRPRAPPPCTTKPTKAGVGSLLWDVVVELKNDLSICGTLHSVDQNLSIKLTSVSQTLSSTLRLLVKNCFISGSVVIYVQLPADEADMQLL